MKATELGPIWLRSRARELRDAATLAEQAYKGELYEMCTRVARAYRKAAVVLDDAATNMEDELTK